MVVSHDREFLDGLVSKVYEFGGGRVREHLGGIYDFLRRKNIGELDELQRLPSSPAATEGGEEEKAATPGRADYERQKERQRKIRKLERTVEQCEARIGELEAEVRTVEERMATPDGAAEVSLYERRTALKARLDEAVDEWERASTALDEAQS